MSDVVSGSTHGRADRFMRSASEAVRCFVYLGLFLVIALFDHLTGWELSFSIFYLAPVSLAAWYSRRVVAMSAAVAAGLTWLGVDIVSGHPYSQAAIPLWNAGVRMGFFVITARLIGRVRELLDHEHLLARVDPLTGLLNQRAFADLASRAIALARRYREPITVAYFDIDDFKSINDALGHSGGDAVLRSFAHSLGRAVRGTDLVARLGGDEFVIALLRADRAAAATALEKVRAAVATAMTAQNLSVTTSIGAVVFETAPSSLDQALQEADAVMYEAKAAGKNAIHVRTRS